MVRDPLPVEPVAADIVQVFDLVGLNINGYVGGKEYYGNVYFKNGVKFAGTTVKSGTDIRVFETRESSISGVDVPVTRLQRIEENIVTSVSTTDVITADPEVSQPTTPTTTVTPESTPTTTPTSSPTPDPTPYTPPSTDSGGSGGGGYGY